MPPLTPNDLAKKTDRQLTAMFQEASRGLSATGADLAVAQALVTMILTEIGARRQSP